VCIGHADIGHLGIFLSAKIARKEHKEIIASFDMLTYLPPGLYEMRIEEDPDQAGEYPVKYIEKNMDDRGRKPLYAGGAVFFSACRHRLSKIA
jgi:hypothetical protein